MMRRNGGGSIVNIASISGLRASTLRVAYGTSKAAVIHLTKQQAVEFSSYGIRANQPTVVLMRPVWAFPPSDNNSPMLRMNRSTTCQTICHSIQQTLQLCLLKVGQHLSR
jgi:NAD(P)-dependent dehydrogenase (short-subunit alcohol dehydrogenase family)